MTYWTIAHPGNKDAERNGNQHPIKKWAENTTDEHPGWYLIFPSTHPTDESLNHGMSRWDANNNKFDYVGRFGDTVQFGNLPNGLRTTDIVEYFGIPFEKTGQ
eukprot:5711278-Ditylum_brightwellii.AAC.1